ncbi:MAG: RHS repeat protein [Planctomycetota bacterium]|nr:RHS repeat protein [Planctomycetota bacterium]
MTRISVPEPSSNRAVPVQAGQTLRLEAADFSSPPDWFLRVNGGAWSQFAAGQTEVFLTTPTSVTERLTFDRLEVALGASSTPDTGTTRHFDLCEGPVATPLVTATKRNEALEEPPLRGSDGEDDDPPLGVPLAMLGPGRQGLATVPLETAAEQGGPASLVASLGPGLFVDSAGKLGCRTPFTTDVRGLGPFPAIAAYHHAGLHVPPTFGASRTLGLTRALFEDGAGHVAVVRGDGRRNTYRWTGSAFEAAAGLHSVLRKVGAEFEEETASGRVYRYTSDGALERVVDRHGHPAYYRYDADDRLQKIEGLGGGTPGLVPYLSYDASGRLARLVLEDPLAPANDRASYFHYDLDDNLVALIGPEHCVTYFTYTPAGLLESVSDPDGYTWRAGYDGSGRVDRLADALEPPATGHVYFAYDPGAALTTHRDRAGKVTYFRYTAWGGPDRVFGPDTPADYYDFDGDGHLVRAEDRLGRAWTYEYDPRGHRIAVNDPLGARTYFAFDGDDLVEVEDPLGRTTRLAYDAARDRTRWIDPLGHTVYYEYQPSGLLHFRKDRRGAFTYFAFDPRGNLSAATDALGHTTTFAHGSGGERAEQTDPLGRVVRFEHDKRGRLVKQVDPLGAATYLAYDGRCNLVAQTDARLHTTTHEHDGNGNRTLTLDALGDATYFAFDPEERLAQQKNARLNATTWTYDALGRRQKQIDALGFETYFVFDAAHQLERQVDARGHATYFEYDLAGRPSHQKNALFDRVYFGYDLAGQRVLTLDPRQEPTTFEYDPRGWLRRTTSAIGAVTYSGFDDEGHQVRSVNPRGHTTYFTYDLAGRLTHTEDARGGVTYAGYDAANQIVLRTDELGAPTYFSYDLAGRQRAVLAPSGLLTYHGHDLVGNLVLTRLDEGWGRQPWGSSPYGGRRASTTHTYDEVGRRLTTTDALGAVSSTDYDRVGNVERAIDPRGVTTYFTYDALERRTHTKDGVHFAETYLGFDEVGNVVLQADAQGVSTYMTYDRLNRAEFVHDPAGALTYHAFDAAGNRTETRVLLGPGGAERTSTVEHDAVNRVVRQIAADSGETYFEYDLAGNQVRVVDPEGRPTYFSHDELERQDARWNAFGDTWQTVHDARSRATRQIDPEGRTTYLGYDLAGRLLHQSNALGEYSYFFHDARGQRALVRNPRGFETSFRHDLLGRQTHRVDALGGMAYMGYDPTGNRTMALDEKGNPTYFAHDGLGRLSRSTDALGGVTYLGYDSRSSMTLRVDADGRATYMAYDGARRLERTWFESPGTTLARPIYYSYDPVGNLLESDDSLANLGVSTFEYDPMDRLLRKVTVAGPVYYSYDLSGLKTSVTDPNEDEVFDHHDEAGRLVRVTTVDYVEDEPPPPPIVRENYFHFDRSGLIERKVLAGDKVVSYFAYDEAGRVSELLNLDDTGAVLTSQVYQRNPNGGVTRVAHENGEFTYYSYDALDRLVEERRVQNPTVYGFAYQYDAASNRTQRADLVEPTKTTDYVINALNLIQSETTDSVETAYEYDQAQRMTLRASPSLATYFTHDERDLPTRLEFESTDVFTDDPREFHYTGTGERAVIVGELGGTTPTLLAYDGTKLLTERMPGGFTWGEYRWAGGSLIGSEGQESGNFEGPVMDERGSVERLAGVSGQAIYDQFGVELVNNLGSLTRTRFVSPVFLRLNTTGERFSLTPHGIYLATTGCLSLGSVAPFRQFLSAGFVGQIAPEGAEERPRGFGWHNQVAIVDRGGRVPPVWARQDDEQVKADCKVIRIEITSNARHPDVAEFLPRSGVGRRTGNSLGWLMINPKRELSSGTEFPAPQALRQQELGLAFAVIFRVSRNVADCSFKSGAALTIKEVSLGGAIGFRHWDLATGNPSDPDNVMRGDVPSPSGEDPHPARGFGATRGLDPFVSGGQMFDDTALSENVFRSEQKRVIVAFDFSRSPLWLGRSYERREMHDFIGISKDQSTCTLGMDKHWTLNREGDSLQFRAHAPQAQNGGTLRERDC